MQSLGNLLQFVMRVRVVIVFDSTRRGCRRHTRVLTQSVNSHQLWVSPIHVDAHGCILPNATHPVVPGRAGESLALTSGA